MTPPPLPRWFLLLPLIAAAAWWPWWPWRPYWQSDDFLALHYAADFTRVLHDFVGPQYGATDVWWFYRPLITLSFWLDQQFVGTTPYWSHASNTLAHATSALLVGLVWRRFLPDGGAFAAGVVWALMPGHAGSIVWAVGRVDSHTVVWCLLAVWFVLRADERRTAGERAARWPAALMTTLALASKELAVVVPPLATLLVFVRTPAGPFAERARHALRTSAAPWLVLAAYVPWRFFVLGRFGGYAGAMYEPAAMANGLVHVLADIGVPLSWVGLDAAPATLPAWPWLVAAALPPLIALLVALMRRARLVGGACVAFVIAVVPVAGFLAAAENAQTLRYYYLPAAALAGVVAVAGRWCTIAVLLAWAWPLIAVRVDWQRADSQTLAMHVELLLVAKMFDAHQPMFVAGLPRTSPSGLAVQLHFGVDRLLREPFGDRPPALYALRPLGGPDTFRLFEGAPFALPEPAITSSFAAPDTLERAQPGAALPELPVAGDDGGGVDFTTPRLDALAADPAATAGLRFPGVRAPFFRTTIFTAGGYLACLSADHALPDSPDGALLLRRWFGADGAAYGPAPGMHPGDALAVPATVDLVPEFPVLMEAGTFAGGAFTPTHRARRLLRFRFDRGYPAWVRRVQGKE